MSALDNIHNQDTVRETPPDKTKAKPKPKPEPKSKAKSKAKTKTKTGNKTKIIDPKAPDRDVVPGQKVSPWPTSCSYSSAEFNEWKRDKLKDVVLDDIQHIIGDILDTGEDERKFYRKFAKTRPTKLKECLMCPMPAGRYTDCSYIGLLCNKGSSIVYKHALMRRQQIDRMLAPKPIDVIAKKVYQLDTGARCI